MKKKSQKTIEENIDSILRDIKTKVLNSKKYSLDDVHVHEISFSANDGGCRPGQKQVCQNLGNDPFTGKPIIKCSCVPDPNLGGDA